MFPYNSPNQKAETYLWILSKETAHSFDLEGYHQRNKVKTVFSVLKIKNGESLKSRKYRLQVKEMKMKVILYNLSRVISVFVLLIFLLRISTKTQLMGLIRYIRTDIQEN